MKAPGTGISPGWPQRVIVARPVELLSTYQFPSAGRHTARSVWPSALTLTLMSAVLPIGWAGNPRETLMGRGAAAYPAVQQATPLSHVVIRITKLAYGLLAHLCLLHRPPSLWWNRILSAPRKPLRASVPRTQTVHVDRRSAGDGRCAHDSCMGDRGALGQSRTKAGAS